MQTESKFKLQHSFSLEDVSPILTIQSYNRRFSTAIDISLCSDWMARFSEQLTQSFTEIYGLSVTITSPTLDTITETLVDLLGCNNPPHAGQSVVRTALTRATEAVNLQINWINARVKLGDGVRNHDPIMPSHLASYCEFLFDQGFRLDDLMLRLQKNVAQGTDLQPADYTIPLHSGSIYLLGRFIVISRGEVYYLLPSYLISLIVSKSIELGACLLSIMNARRSDNASYCSNVVTFLSWMQNVLREYGNTGHTLLKALDGIGHGIMTEDLDDGHSPYLLTNIVADLNASGFRNHVISQGIKLLRSFPAFDIPNITGLSKIYGHPTIDTRKGMEKLYLRTHAEITISDDAVRRVINMAKLLFLAHYWKKHKAYPLLTIGPTTLRPLVRALLAGKSFTAADYTIKYGKVKPGDFEDVDLLPCVPFDWFDRFYPLLKDKAAAPRRSLIDKALLEDGMHIPGSRRVLLTYLRQPNLIHDWRVFRRKFCHNPKLVKDEMVIKLTSKEKEQKIEGRMFGQSPILERQRRIVGEANVAHLMEMYNTDQCMLVNEHDKRKRMAFLSRASAYAKDAYTIIIGVDAEAWNNYFRAQLVNEFGREFFDRIFGVEFYQYTMSVFNLAFVYHRDSADDIIYWDGQEGGIEGLAQKVWTWIYTVIARLVLYLTELDGYMMVNGDDMRIILIVPKSRVNNDESELERFQRDLLEKLRELFRIYGIVMKVDETNMTRSLLCFGRNYVIDGISLPGDIKKIIKAGGLTDVGFPSITDVIASITSNAHSACGLSFQIVPHVTFAYTMILLYLHWHRFLTLTPSMQSSAPLARTEDTALLLTIPNTLGGLDTLMLYQFIIQGESDPVPLCLDWLTYLWHYHTEFRPAIKRVLSIPVESTPPRSLLITDVYSLPLKRPPRPASLIQARIRKYLLRMTRNSELRKLLQYDTLERHKILNSLWSMDPYNPRIASYLYSLSPCALVDSIIQKFDSAPTLASVIFRNDRKRNFKLYALVIKADRKLIGTIVRRVLQGTETYTDSLQTLIPLIDQRVCATAQAIFLRQKLWRKESLVDSTIPSVLQQMMIVTEGTLDPSLQTFDQSSPHVDHFTARTARLVQTPSRYGPLCKLMCTPFFAHTTGLRLGSRLAELKGNEPMISMIRKLTDAQALLSDQGGDIAEWADWCSICLFGESIDIVCPSVVKKLGGTIGHRLPSWSFERTVYLNTLPSRTGRSRANLDTVGRKGSLFSKNRTHNYSAMTCWFQYHCTCDLENDLLSPGVDQLYWGVLVSCRDRQGSHELCMCHEEVKNHTYSILPPPGGLTARLERLINGCELTRMSEESYGVLAGYKTRFSKLWFGAYEYDAWLASDMTEAKYNLASETACLIICSELEPAVVMYSGYGTLDESLMFNSVLGRVTNTMNFSVKDFMALNMDHLARALVQTCLGFLLESIIPPQSYSLARWAKVLLPPGTFYGLCQSLFIGRAHGRFLLALNNYAEGVGSTGIPVNYDILISPLAFSRSLSRFIANLCHGAVVNGIPTPASYLIFLPGMETDLKVKQTYLTHLWRILLTAVISGRGITQLAPPSKSSVLETLVDPYRTAYLAVCYLMSRAYQVTGAILCEGYVREVELQPDDWFSALPGAILTWDPLVEYIMVQDICADLMSSILECAEEIINYSFLRSTTVKIVITRLPFKVCMEACKSWMHDVVLDTPGDASMVIHPVVPPADAFSCAVLPLDSDLPLKTLLPPVFNLRPVPMNERVYWDPACLSRYYQLSTSALNKFLECLLTIRNFHQIRHQKVLLLATADGAGGVSVLLTRLFPNAIAVFNTLQADPSAQVGLGDCPDSGFLDLNEVSRLRSQQNSSGSNDLTDDRTIDRLLRIGESEGGKYWCITCDAEGHNLESSETDPHLTTGLIKLMNKGLVEGGCVIIKRFISSAPHQVKLFMYMASTFAAVSIFKPESSHKSSGEIFFLGYSKTRLWSNEKVDSFLQNPTSSYDTIRYYFNMMTELGKRRIAPLPGTPIVETLGVTVPYRIQILLRMWCNNSHRLLASCQYIPRTWFNATGHLVASTDEIKTFITTHQSLYPSSFSSWSKYVAKSYMMSYGCSIVCLSIKSGMTFSEMDSLRKTHEELISIHRDSVGWDVTDMCIRHFRVGGRQMLSLLGTLSRGLLTGPGDGNDIPQDDS